MKFATLRFRTILLATFCLALLAPLGVWAQPATAPSRPERQRGSGMAMFDQLERALQRLELSEQQRAEVHEIVETARTEFREMAAELQEMAPRDRMERLRERLDAVREQIMQVLDEPQRQSLREAMEQFRRRGPDGEPGGERGPAQFARRLRDAIGQIELSEEQKQQVQTVLDDLQQNLRTIRQELRDDMEQFRERAREITNSARLELQEILDPQQRERLREIMEEEMNPRGRRDGAQMRPQDPPPASAPQDPQDAPAGEPKEGPRAALPPPPAPHPLVGQPAPAFALTKLDGRNVELSSFQGRILVVLFGNYSSPVFRGGLANFEQLRKEYANRADFLIVYTRESHPVGQWEVERNKRDKIAVEQPADADARKALAQQARQVLKITIPIALDTMDDRTAAAYGSDGKTAAVVIGRDGKVLAYWGWGDAHALRRVLGQAVASRN